MGTRVPVQHYDLRPDAVSYIQSPLDDLNAGEGLGGASDDVDRGGGDITEESLDNDEESTAVHSELSNFLLAIRFDDGRVVAHISDTNTPSLTGLKLFGKLRIFFESVALNNSRILVSFQFRPSFVKIEATFMYFTPYGREEVTLPSSNLCKRRKPTPG
ncbi:unnamed protein product [Cuscuta epithymum]|uniref:Uncharacterized protein n=1 Tax=Cuscuta epithymum TaxID=186058 RepID=A0AAV0G3P2_9ASTE|nr:unnamed protein product [Cuscuta epithymum]CAH9142349.1 unnamed protein product [Cuscuta epithymum]